MPFFSEATLHRPSRTASVTCRAANSHTDVQTPPTSPVGVGGNDRGAANRRHAERGYAWPLHPGQKETQGPEGCCCCPVNPSRAGMKPG